MALKPTIYKLKVALSDLDRQVYETLNLTIARHPSETMERMMVRVMAFCFNAKEQLVFCKGLSDTEEPDLWMHSLEGNLELWIDVGEPASDRIKKATRVASLVKVYCFNNKASTWWEKNRSNLADKVERTMDVSITITENSAYVATKRGECEVSLLTLQQHQI
jgi:uncharacterized protein YaeQ